MIRMYFNIRNADNGLVWSVDQGSQDSEVNVGRAIISASMETGFDSEAKWPNPCGWLYSETAQLSIDLESSTAHIYERLN